MKRTSGCLVTLLICLSALTAPALAQQTARPESVGMSAARLERIDELMQERIDANWFPGAVTLVARSNQIVHLETHGLMDIESARPMRTDAVFRIMSMTKPVVSVALLMLVEEGRIHLTDPVSRFIPELGGLSVAADTTTRPASRPTSFDITIRDVLTHTAGLMTRSGVNQPQITIGPNDSLADVVPQLEGVALDFEPGSNWSYSGQYGFDMLARVVEIAADMPFDTFTQLRIFDPLGMRDTFFFPPEGHPNIASLYEGVDGELRPRADLDFVNGHYFSGGGGLFSTAGDYLRFATMLLHGGELDGTRLLGRKTVELMRSAFVPASLPGRTAGEGYGLGVRVVTDRAARGTLLSDGSFGWSGAFNTHFFIDPEEEIIAIYMTQSAFLPTRQELRDDFETAVMQAVVGSAASH